MAAFQVITEGGCECSVRSVPPEVGVVLIRTLNRLDKVAGFPNALLGRFGRRYRSVNWKS
jgi:hypothetical protein